MQESMTDEASSPLPGQSMTVLAGSQLRPSSRERRTTKLMSLGESLALETRWSAPARMVPEDSVSREGIR